MRPAIRKRIIAYSIFLALCVGLWYGIRENYKPDYGGALAPIIKAARDGNIDELQAILEQAEVSIEYRGAFSATPLACEKNDARFLRPSVENTVGYFSFSLAIIVSARGDVK